jgi:hypothetical protein
VLYHFLGIASWCYQPRQSEASMLHMVIREHLDDFLRTAANQANGASLPEFIVREFRDPRFFLSAG